MASLVRIGFMSVTNGTKNSISNKGTIQTAIRNISGKTIRAEPRAPKPAPWPYETKSYTLLNYIYDKTTKRFDDNTKLIVVEGPVAAGKSKFAKELAAELEMAYFPEANLDMMYVNEYGFNLKQLDEQLPESCRSFDVNNFLLNPKHRLTATFQLKQYGVRYSQYIDALAHIFSTGQGVILDRCVHSDFVFVEAMYSQGYLSRGARSAYYEIRKNSIRELLRPHLIIYLDVPITKTLENIKKRKIGYEVGSSVLTPSYLGVMERHYKQQYLKEANVHAELLVYDWSNEGEVEVVVEDIERINFVRPDEQDPKFKDWEYYLEEDFAVLRYQYSDRKDHLMTYLNVPRYDVPELVVEAHDAQVAREVINNAPGMQFLSGYNSKMGDSGLLFKDKAPLRHTLPRIERSL